MSHAVRLPHTLNGAVTPWATHWSSATFGAAMRSELPSPTYSSWPSTRSINRRSLTETTSTHFSLRSVLWQTWCALRVSLSRVQTACFLIRMAILPYAAHRACCSRGSAIMYNKLHPTAAAVAFFSSSHCRPPLLLLLPTTCTAAAAASSPPSTAPLLRRRPPPQ